MTGSRPRSTLLAAALAVMLGGGTALPALAEAPIGMRDNRQVDYGATATVDAALNAYLSNAQRSATAGAFDAVSSGRYASPAATALRNLTMTSDALDAAYDTGRFSGAFAAPVAGDAIRAALRDQAAGEGRFTVDASLSIAPIGRGLLADRTSDAFGRLSFGRALDMESLATNFAAQTSGDGALREAMRADAGERSLFANQGGSFSSSVSSDVLAGAFAGGSEAPGAFAAPAANTGLQAAMRSEGSGSGFSGGREAALSVAVDLEELAAGLASDSLDQADFAADSSLSSATVAPVLDAMRAERSGGGFLAAEAGLSRPQAVDFERIAAILAGADEE